MREFCKRVLWYAINNGVGDLYLVGCKAVEWHEKGYITSQDLEEIQREIYPTDSELFNETPLEGIPEGGIEDTDEMSDENISDETEHIDENNEDTEALTNNPGEGDVGDESEQS